MGDPGKSPIETPEDETRRVAVCRQTDKPGGPSNGSDKERGENDSDNKGRHNPGHDINL